MSQDHQALITRFYQAFQRLDAQAMADCYTADVVFSDPVFGELRGQNAADMWRMLTSRAKDFSLTFDQVKSVAKQLGNTPAVCRKCYIHPAVLDGFALGYLAKLPRPRVRKGLKAEEVALAMFLEQMIAASPASVSL